MQPSGDKKCWQYVQRTIEAYFAEYGADPAVSTDESRLLRLVPFPNLKYGDSKLTSVLDASPQTKPHSIDDLKHAFKSISKQTAERRRHGPRETVIRKGERNIRLTRLAGSMRRHGVSRQVIEDCLLSENELRCEPPLENAEVRKIADSISRYEPSPLHKLSGIKVAASREGEAAERNITFYTARQIAIQVSERVDWIARPWIARGAITEIDGKVKAAGKTTFLLHLSRCVVEGLQFMGEPTSKTNVVYLTEEPKRTFREALRRAGLVDSADFTVLFWHDCYQVDWAVLVSAAVEECKRCGAGLLIVDTLGQFSSIAGDGENNAGEALAAVQPLQLAAGKEGLAIAFTRHERKSGGEVGDSGRGSSATAGAVDTVISLRRGEGNSSENVRVMHALSRLDETPKLSVIELIDGEYVFHGSDSHVAIRKARVAILEAAPDSEEMATTLDQLKESAGTKRTVTQQVVTALLQDGVLKRTGNGKKGSSYRFWRPTLSTSTDRQNAILPQPPVLSAAETIEPLR